MKSVTQFELAWELYRAGLNGEDIGKRIGKDRATIYRWIAGIKKLGIREFVRRKKECKRRRQPHTLTPDITRRIEDIRRRWGWCGQKIQKELKEIYGINVCVMSIYRVLKKTFVIGSAWKKYKKRDDLVKPTAPREEVQHDTVDFGQLFAYTAIDTFTKEPAVVIEANLLSQTGVKTLKLQQAYYGEVMTHQSDEGPEFKGQFPVVAKGDTRNHRYSRPYKKNDQAEIENFNRSLRKECLGWGDYTKDDLSQVQARVDRWLSHWMYERWHMGLPDMQTPAEFTTSWYAERNQKYEPVAFAL